jgi:hypothetical protein
VKNEVRKWSEKMKCKDFYSLLIRSEKMKWENEVQRFYLLFILEYSFFYEWSVLGQIRSVIGVNKN